MAEVWELDLPQPLKLLALSLADIGNDEGERIYPSVRHIARKVGAGRRTIQRQLRALEDLGILEVVERGTGRGNTTRYRIIPAKGAILPPIEPEPERAPPATKRASRGAERASPEAERASPAPPQPLEPSREPLEPYGAVAKTTTRPRRPVDDYWDALAAVMGHGPEITEEPLWGRFTNRVLRSGVSTEEFRIRAERLALQWGIGKLTVRSLERHWERFGAPIGAVAPHQEDAMQAEFAARATSAALAEYDRVKRLNPPSGPPVTGEGTPA